MSETYGFVKIERDFVKSVPGPQSPTVLTDLSLPSSPLASKVLNYVQNKLTAQTLNHSIRVFLYSRAIIKDQFPKWTLSEEIIFITSLLHDIGTTKENLSATKLSFEYYGGIVARDLLLKESKDADLSDAVAEAIFRHQDLNDNGFITQLGLIIQISTVLDNAGFEVVSKLIHKDTLSKVNKEYPRDGWLQCFADVINEENKLKPWGHSSSLGVKEFPENVLKNKLEY